MEGFGLTYIWLIIGFLMLVVELFSLSFFAFFIALGALFTAILTFFGVLPTLTWQVLVFATSSVLSLIFLRRVIKSKFSRAKNGKEYTEFSGDIVLVTRAIPENGTGRIFYRGTEWEARSDDGSPKAAGEQVAIVKMDGIVAIVK